MNLSSLSLVNFKNYEQAEMAFSAGINCLLGPNGEGKTNVLDAIHVLSFCKSYFNPIDSHSVRFEQPFFMVQGEFEVGEATDVITCSVKKGKKKSFKRNKTEYDRLADHIGRYPVVMITPYDSNLILGGSEVRRKLLDGIISQFDKAYLSSLIKYNRALDQRNAFLKQHGPADDINMSMLDVFDDQLVAEGTKISQHRAQFIEQSLMPLFVEAHKVITNEEEEVGLHYSSQVNKETYEAKLKDSLSKDRITQYTNVGIHKDDLVFTIHNHPLKKFGSQGQQKSFLIALKLAHYQCLKAKLGMPPILLLDDIFDKLDQTRVLSLLKIITAEDVGQTFITDTSTKRVPDLLKELELDCKVFEVKEGVVHEA